MPKLTDKKPAAVKKAEEKDAEKEVKKVKEIKVARDETKPKSTIREAKAKAQVKEREAPKSNTNTVPSAATKSHLSTSNAPSHRTTPTMAAAKIRTRKVVPTGSNASTPRAKPKVASRDAPQKERTARPTKPAMPVNTKPKNPSPLSASPPVNASDFEDNHPVHKALSSTASPAKNGNSDRSLKRKANDIDSDIHNHNLSVKQARVDRPTPLHTPSSTNGRASGSTPASANSLKRKSDDSSTSNTPTNKIRKVTNIDTGIASRYPHHANHTSPGDSSSSATSPSVPSLSFRQTVELSQRFQKYYKKYEELYWQLAEAATAPTEAQRNDLMKMHKKLEEMKREIKAGAGGSRT